VACSAVCSSCSASHIFVSDGLLPQPTELDLIKLQWMLPHEDGDACDSSVEKNHRWSLSEVRFGWDGEACHAALSTSGFSPADGLHNHCSDPDRAGYTISELLRLSMSAVMSQRVLPLRALSNIAAKCRSSSYREGPRLLLFMSTCGACASACSGMLSESVSVVVSACALACNFAYSTAIISARNGRPVCSHLVFTPSSLYSSPLLVVPHWTNSAASAFDALQQQQQCMDVLLLDPCTQLMVQGFAHHAAAVLQRFISRDSNVPPASACHVMLTMRVLACTSVDYCREFVDSGAVQRVMDVAVAQNSCAAVNCQFDWASADDAADLDAAVAALRLLNVLCKASRATASRVCGTGVLDSCMRWFFLLPLEQESPLLQSLLMLWHTCCCYGIAINAFADVADKLNVVFCAQHHALQVAELCCAYLRCSGLERASADVSQVVYLIKQLVRDACGCGADDLSGDCDSNRQSALAPYCLMMLVAVRQLDMSSSSAAAAAAELSSEATIRSLVSRVEVNPARVIASATAFFTSHLSPQVSPEYISLSRDLFILHILYTCRRLLPSLGLGQRVPACALVHALQSEAACALAHRCIPSLKGSVIRGSCLPPVYSLAVATLVSGLACHSLSIPTLVHPAVVLGIFCSGTLQHLRSFECTITSVNWKGACGLRSNAAASVAMWKAVFGGGAEELVVGDDDALMISAVSSKMKDVPGILVENWQFSPAGDDFLTFCFVVFRICVSFCQRAYCRIGFSGRRRCSSAPPLPLLTLDDDSCGICCFPGLRLECMPCCRCRCCKVSR
jgi:hypothetical protein